MSDTKPPEAFTLDDAERVPSDVERDLSRLESRLTEAQTRYAQRVTNSGYDPDLKAVAVRVNRPDLDTVEVEVSTEAAQLRARLHAVAAATETSAPALTDAEMAAAASHLPFVERQAANADLATLITGVKAALTANDRAKLYALVEVLPERVKKARESNQPILDQRLRAELGHLLTEARARLADPRPAGIRKRALDVAVKAAALQRKASKRQGDEGRKKIRYLFQKDSDVPWAEGQG